MKIKLLENIEAVKKLYPQISNEDFYKLIALDPTYNSNRDSVGLYGKWILNLFNKGKLDNEGHVTDILIRFNEVKSQLKEKDINRFKTLEELDSYLDNSDNYIELSARQKLRQTQTNVHNTNLTTDAEKVFENSIWEVWVPHTYEASCKLGQGTKWCTASTSSDYYYERYSKEGPLYILIDKYDRTIKYQFHFPSNQYMDSEDDSINPWDDIFDMNDDLKEFFRPELLKSWKLDPTLSFKESISIVLTDKDFYQILADKHSYSRNTIKGIYIYDILYSPNDYFTEDFYGYLTKDEFDSFVTYELTSETRKLLTQALGGTLTYDSLYESAFYDELNDLINSLKTKAYIDVTQNFIMQSIEDIFKLDDLKVEWYYNENYYLEITGSLEDFIPLNIYNEDNSLNLSTEIHSWIGGKIKEELEIYEDAILNVDGSIDTETLNTEISLLLQ